MKWVSGVCIYLRKGQAEVVGGIIAISVLLFSIATLYFLMTSTQSSFSTEFARRASFESEKNAEKIAVSYDLNTDSCIVSNAGAISITIVRAWQGNKYFNFNEPLPLPPGQALLSWPFSKTPDIIVTARGNIFTVKAECEKIKNAVTNMQQIIVGSGIASTLITSETLLNNMRISKGIQQGYLYASVLQNNYAVLYYNGSKYLCSSPSDKNVYSSAKLPQDFTWDLDANNINEIIISTYSTCPAPTLEITEYGSDKQYVYGKGFKGSVMFMFKNLVLIPQGGADTITVYFKVVLSTEGGGTPQNVVVSPTIVLSCGSQSLSSPATVTTSGSGSGTIVITGFAIFPVKAFSLPLQPDSVYDLTLDLKFDVGPSIDLKKVRLEYLAIVGAYINDLWK
jgi:uncharacterized protein (UPF0333 family)